MLENGNGFLVCIPYAGISALVVGKFVLYEATGMRHNEKKSTYGVLIYSYVICISNREKFFPETALAFGGCIMEPQATV